MLGICAEALTVWDPSAIGQLKPACLAVAQRSRVLWKTVMMPHLSLTAMLPPVTSSSVIMCNGSCVVWSYYHISISSYRLSNYFSPNLAVALTVRLAFFLGGSGVMTTESTSRGSPLLSADEWIYATKTAHSDCTHAEWGIMWETLTTETVDVSKVLHRPWFELHPASVRRELLLEAEVELKTTG